MWLHVGVLRRMIAVVFFRHISVSRVSLSSLLRLFVIAHVLRLRSSMHIFLIIRVINRLLSMFMCSCMRRLAH